MENKLTDEQIKEYRESFSFFDKGKRLFYFSILKNFIVYLCEHLT